MKRHIWRRCGEPAELLFERCDCHFQGEQLLAIHRLRVVVSVHGMNSLFPALRNQHYSRLGEDRGSRLDTLLPLQVVEHLVQLLIRGVVVERAVLGDHLVSKSGGQGLTMEGGGGGVVVEGEWYAASGRGVLQPVWLQQGTGGSVLSRTGPFTCMHCRRNLNKYCSFKGASKQGRQQHTEAPQHTCKKGRRAQHKCSKAKRST